MTWIFLISLSVFAYSLILLLLAGLNSRKLRVSKRLSDIKNVGNNAEILRKERRPKENTRLSFLRISNSMRESILLSGIKMSPEEFVLFWILCIFAPAILAFTISPQLLRSIILIIIGMVLPPWYLNFATSKRRLLFERQLGDALMVLSNGLRAGLSFQQALNNVARDLPDPIGMEFRAIGRELQLGVEVEESLSKVAQRMKSSDMLLLTTAVSVQIQVGGNLSEILDSISKTIRERLSIKRSIRTLTAQGRISGKIIGFLPVLLLVVISAISPDYVAPFFTTTFGYVMIAISLIMETIGFLVISKIVNIKF